jgi:hypothetical protein
MNSTDTVVKSDFNQGLTVKELKSIIKDWPDTNEDTGEPCEVWISTSEGLTNAVKIIYPLNKREDDSGNFSADLCFEP